MNESQKTVTLPDGIVVTVSETNEAWCVSQDGKGYVDPNTIAPDPDQPRQWMNPVQLAELKESIATAGVREPITVTPRSAAPWARVEPEHESCFFLAVSGHRRREGACESNLPAVPIRIKIYRDEAEHREDASLLNGNRADLTPLEEGREMVRMRKLGRTIESICKHHGYSAPKVYARMNLTKLHPDIQNLISPELAAKQRLSTSVAGALGGIRPPTQTEWVEVHDTLAPLIRDKSRLIEPFEEATDDDRRFALQRLLLETIQQRKLKMVRAIELIRDQVLKLVSHSSRGGPKTERLQPAKRREVVANFVSTISDSVLMDWSPAEFRRVFDLAPREELDEIVVGLEEAEQSVSGFIKILKQVRDSKRPTHPDALRLIETRKAEALKRSTL